MTTDAIRSMIREVLAEELQVLRKQRASSGASKKSTNKPVASEEVVHIENDQDLQALVQKVLKLGQNKSMADKIQRGQHVFRLGRPGTSKAPERQAKATSTAGHSQGSVVHIEQGYLSEKQVDNLPEGTTTVCLGPKVRFTPLARDRLRQRKIVVERMR